MRWNIENANKIGSGLGGLGPSSLLAFSIKKDPTLANMDQKLYFDKIVNKLRI